MIDLIYFVHQTGPFLEGALFFYRDVFKNEIPMLFIFVGIFPETGVDFAVCRTIIVFIIVRHDSEIVGVIDPEFFFDFVEYSIGKGKETF